MKENKKRSNSIHSMTAYKRKFTLSEMWISAIFAPRAIFKLIGNKSSELIDQKFVERLQLAVTEVNGCALCAYGHAKMALRQGMNNKEISSFLSAEKGEAFIKPEESKAILFAQHFAESRGYPKKYAYDSIVKEYGEEKAKLILSAVQMIIMGNMYGIPLSAFQSRLRGKPYTDSTVLYELKMIVLGILILPFAIILGLLRGLFVMPNERFDMSLGE